jgi:hypothetical protein
MFKSTPTRAEQAVQKKVRDGQRLSSDDREVVQTRLRAMQKRGDYVGMTGGVPSGAENLVAAPNVQPAMSAMQATANGVSGGSVPDLSSHGGDLELKIRQINAQNTTSFFSFTMGTHTVGVPETWSISGSFSLGPLSLVGSGGTAGTGGGATGTAGGSTGNSSTTTGTGGSVSGTATGPLGTTGASGSATGSASHSTGTTTGGSTSGGGTAGQSSGGANLRETYKADILCTYSIRMEPETTINPLSWLPSAFVSPKTGHGTATGCGWLQFTLPST